jgi:hypothetical protein
VQDPVEGTVTECSIFIPSLVVEKETARQAGKRGGTNTMCSKDPAYPRWLFLLE